MSSSDNDMIPILRDDMGEGFKDVLEGKLREMETQILLKQHENLKAETFKEEVTAEDLKEQFELKQRLLL